MANLCVSPRVAGVVFAFLLNAGYAAGGLCADSAPQGSSSIVIRVSDANGTPLSAVELTLRGPDASTVATGVTDAQGRCRLLGLDSVVYKARASDPRTALDEAATGAARAVRRTLGRQEPRGSRSGAVPVSTHHMPSL